MNKIQKNSYWCQFSAGPVSQQRHPSPPSSSENILSYCLRSNLVFRFNWRFQQLVGYKRIRDQWQGSSEVEHYSIFYISRVNMVSGSGHERAKRNKNRTFGELLCARVSLLSGGLTVSRIKPVITLKSYKHRPEISLDWLEAQILFHFIFAWICSHKIVADEKYALLQCKLPAFEFICPFCSGDLLCCDCQHMRPPSLLSSTLSSVRW